MFANLHRHLKTDRPLPAPPKRGSIPAVLLLLLAGWGAITLARDLARLAAAREPAVHGEPVAHALARHEGRLAEARSWWAARHDDGPAGLRVATLEFHRQRLLGLAAAEATPQGNPAAVVETVAAAAAGDPLPERRDALRRAVRAARVALRAGCDGRAGVPLTPVGRRHALEIVASACFGLGDPSGEVAALTEATRQEPDNARLWDRLASACARAGRFRQAHAARDRMLSLVGGPVEAVHDEIRLMEDHR